MIKEIENLPDLSFIDGVTLENIQSAMVADYEAKYKELTNKELHLKRGDPQTLMLYAASVQIYQMYLNIEKAGRMDLLKYAYGQYLDHLGANRGVSRLPATPAKVTMRFTLSAQMQSVISIPAGTRISNGDMLYFATDEVAEILIGDTYIDIPCTCLEVGEDGNAQLPGVLNTLVDPIPYVDSVVNIDTSFGGADIESDEDYAERIYLAPSGYSVAGPRDAYVYHARTYSSTIGDVKVSSPSEGVVNVIFILTDGSLPSQTEIDGLEAYLRNENLRPLTDHVVVAAPEAVDFDIDLTYYINASDASASITVQEKVNKAIDEYISWQTERIGRDINPYVLTEKIMAAGAKRVEINTPAYTVLTDTQIAQINDKNIVYGGVEDD